MPRSDPTVASTAPRPARLTAASDAPLRRFTGYLIKRAYITVQGQLSTALHPFGLRMITFSALAVIGGNPGLRQSQLASALAVERPNLVAILDELEKRGLVTRNPAPDDRRAHALDLTPAGQRLLGEAEAAIAAQEDRLVQGIAERDLAVLSRALRRIERFGHGGEDA